MGRLMLQKGAKVLANTAVVALEEELVFLYKEVTTGLGLVSLAVTAYRTSTVVQIRTFSLEQLQLRGHHCNEFVVDVKSQTSSPNVNKNHLHYSIQHGRSLVKRPLLYLRE